MKYTGASRIASGLTACLLTFGAFAGEWLPPVRPDLSSEDQQRVAEVTKPTTSFDRPEPFEANQGGAGTVRTASARQAFSRRTGNLAGEQGLLFETGKALFEKLWVAAPSSTQASDGLGPLYNARSCASCHVGNGRGRTPDGILLRLARPPRTGTERGQLQAGQRVTHPDPVYGDQFQNKAVPGLDAEGQLRITYNQQPIRLTRTETITLLQPRYELVDLNYGPLAADTTLSPRLAPPLIGLGLIEAIHPSDLIANTDPLDRDGDGISGRLPWVLDPDTGRLEPGRFGWKSSHASLRSQNAAAFHADIGISTPLKKSVSGDCTPRQTACQSAPHGEQARLGSGEAPDPVLDLVTLYASSLAVPRRRSVDDSQVLRGKAAFYEAGCATCHRPKYVTRRDTDNPANAFQLIWPYSDFLLHDMGPGLADGQTVGDASGSEWRTPPLWGIGLTEAVGQDPGYLHDGRARTLTEAILWHDGEAAASRHQFSALPKQDRDALLAFLGSL